MTKFPNLHINDVKFSDSNYIAYSLIWKATTLIQAVREQECEVFDCPICGLNFSDMPWDIGCFADYVYHMNRIKNTDMSNPIILDWKGYICDGWHRVAKAIFEERTSIKAYRLKTAPMSDGKEKTKQGE